MAKRLFVIIGPSAIGKSYLMQRLLSLYPDSFVAPPLLTTRAPRPEEHAVDRQFISDEKYDEMLRAGEFVWSDAFYGNRYGYTREAVESKDKHVLINALPPMIEEFAALPAVLMVGLTVAPDNFELIRRRLVNRGDPSSAVEKRLGALEKDAMLMAQNQSLINQHGRLFEITDDSTLQVVVIPYLQNYLP